MFEGKRVM
jgi:hypothetical protein